tara:strand:- start:550 stop:1488 length:939 start_codon:yes stop_codon:yes gene_type:complete
VGVLLSRQEADRIPGFGVRITGGVPDIHCRERRNQRGRENQDRFLKGLRVLCGPELAAGANHTSNLRRDSLPEILLLAAIVLAAFIGFTMAGMTGFGGGMTTLPVLVWAFGIREAIPLLAITQVLGSISRSWLNRDEISWPVAKWFTMGAMPPAALGSLLFVAIPTSILVRVLGAALILIVVLPQIPRGPKIRMTLRAFAPIGATAGFLSAVLGIPGPFYAPFYLAYGLSPRSYIGTSSVGMFMVQIPKLAVFGGNGLLDAQAVSAGVALGMVAFLASYLGERIQRRIPQRLFPVIINFMLIAVGVLFVVQG